jgi:hypothetical protein
MVTSAALRDAVSAVDMDATNTNLVKRTAAEVKYMHSATLISKHLATLIQQVSYHGSRQLLIHY